MCRVDNLFISIMAGIGVVSTLFVLIILVGLLLCKIIGVDDKYENDQEGIIKDVVGEWEPSYPVKELFELIKRDGYIEKSNVDYGECITFNFRDGVGSVQWMSDGLNISVDSNIAWLTDKEQWWLFQKLNRLYITKEQNYNENRREEDAEWIMSELNKKED